MTRFWTLLLLSLLLLPGAPSQAAAVDSFEMVWSTLRDHYWDSTMAGLDWQRLHAEYLPKIKSAATTQDARKLINELIHKLPSSHLALIPGLASPSASSHKSFGGPGIVGLTLTVIEGKMVIEFSDDAAVHPGWIINSIDNDPVPSVAESNALQIAQAWLTGPVGSFTRVLFTKGDGAQTTLELPRRAPPGKLVQFGNLPPEQVIAEHHKLPSGVGYIRLNLFLDPASVMPEFQQAVSDFRSAPGIILDLRGNPGGLGIMAMGLAGWFVADEGKILGTLSGRNSKMEFTINPRLEPYTGKLAILVDGASASTSEIFAQGLKDLGRARIFGARTAGQALPSEIIRLPDGDTFEYPEANYTSFKGRILEGNGVEPDVLAPPTIAALLAGHDLALESAITWSTAK